MKRGLSIALVLIIALSLMIITPLKASAGCPFEALTGKYEAVVIRGGGSYDELTVGDVFENWRATVAYYYKGANAAHYGYNHKWYLNGMPLEEGYVFDQVGRFTMTLQCDMPDEEYNRWKKNGVTLPSKTAVASYDFSVLPKIGWRGISEFKLISSMSKTTYRQGADTFDPTNILVRVGFGNYETGDLVITSHQDLKWDELTYHVSDSGVIYEKDTVQITKGYRFWEPGLKKLLAVVVNQQVVIPFTVESFVSSVKLSSAPAMTAGSTISTSDFSVQVNYRDGTSEVISGDSLEIFINGQRMYKGGKYDVPSGNPKIRLHMGEFSMEGTIGELTGKTVSASGDIRVVTVTIDKIVDSEQWKAWDRGQGVIKYTINGGKPVTLFSEGNMPALKTINAKVGDKIQVIWSAGDYSGEGQVYVSYLDDPAANIQDSSRILGSILVGKAKSGSDNVVASFTVSAAPSSPATPSSPAAPSSPTLTSAPSKSVDYGKPPAALKGMSQEEWDVLRLTNIERAKKGLPLLVTFNVLNEGAGIRAIEIGSKFSHDRPDGSGPSTVLKGLGYKYTVFGENIATGQKSAAVVVKDWMNSEGHKANILNESFRHLGVGNSGNNWVQLFSAHSGSEATSIEYNEVLGYFTLTLKSGVTAFAPYDPASSPTKDGKVTFNYPGVVAEGNNSSAPKSTPTPAPSTKTDTVTVKPTNTKFMLNGAEVALPAYEISGNNYVKLRDVGALLKTQFDVRWEDSKAKLYNYKAYTPVGGELAAIGTESKSAKLSTTNFIWGETGAAVTGLTAYEIGGNNFIKLRDIARLFDFDVDWRDNKAWIEPDNSYTDD